VDAGVDESTGLFDSSSQMFLVSVASLLGLLGVAVLAGLCYQFFIYIPRENKGMTNSVYFAVNKWSTAVSTEQLSRK